MRFVIFIGVILPGFLSGCVSSKMPDLPYLSQDSAYSSGMIKKLPCCDILALGYQSWKNELRCLGINQKV